MSKESKKQCVALSESTPNKQKSTDGPAFHQVFFCGRCPTWYKWMRKSLSYATAKKLFLDRVQPKMLINYAQGPNKM